MDWVNYFASTQQTHTHNNNTPHAKCAMSVLSRVLLFVYFCQGANRVQFGIHCLVWDLTLFQTWGSLVRAQPSPLWIVWRRASASRRVERFGSALRSPGSWRAASARCVHFNSPSIDMLWTLRVRRSARHTFCVKNRVLICERGFRGKRCTKNLHNITRTCCCSTALLLVCVTVGRIKFIIRILIELSIKCVL